MVPSKQIKQVMDNMTIMQHDPRTLTPVEFAKMADVKVKDIQEQLEDIEIYAGRLGWD